MSLEGQNSDRKSLRIVTGGTADWRELAKDCVAFANAQGGWLLIGIENGEQWPAADQRVTDELVEKVHRRIGELTVNVMVVVQSFVSDETGGEYLEVTISRSLAPASTTDGRYYLRVSDESNPLVGEEVQRLLNERNAQPWETLTSLGVPRGNYDPSKLAAFTGGIRASDRVKGSVKEKSDTELMAHYYLAIGPHLTNLGILCVGWREGRARLGTAPVIQYIKYDEERRKVNKIVWDDHSLTPMELVKAVWRDVPDFRETYELPEGLFRQHIPVYDQRVVRELLVNALVHRPYTQRGDIYLNLYPDRLQIVNPGLLPLGVTPRNILHQSVRRNNELARVFHDLSLMEREGSGYDLLYEVLTSQGRPLPEVCEGPDRVEITIPRRVIKPEVIDFLAKADQTFQLTQRERIALGILVQHEALTARQLAELLELPDASAVAGWLERLLGWKIIRQAGRTKGTRYFVDPDVQRKLEFHSQTTLARIEPYRLRALILEDLRRHPGAAFGEIQERIGREIPDHQIRRQLKSLAEEGVVKYEGERRWRRYWPV
ncbi:MAG: putative DNA binding domain-containing protein [Spirochaetaceae bacterium]|nr:putative DNA binding domain-containing protein [Spirochaetaceae bacterium]